MTVDDSALSKLVGEPTTTDAEASRRGQDDAAALRRSWRPTGSTPRSDHFTHGDPVGYLDITSAVIAEQHEPDEHW